MKIIRTRNYRELSKTASDIIIHEILKKPNIVIGFPTGKTPLGTYRNLIKEYRRRKIDFSKIRTFNLDEFYPLRKYDQRSYRYYMFKNLFRKVKIPKQNIHLLDGSSKDADKECKRYEREIRKNPIDLQVLGIGPNGHIAFNEPGSSPSSKTRLVNLSPETVKRSKYFDKSLTMGISTILKSKKMLLLASGKKKAKAVYNFMKNKPDKAFPASFLKKHRNLIVIIDKKAGSLL